MTLPDIVSRAQNDGLATLKLAELKQIAASQGLRGTSGMRKGDLVSAIAAAGIGSAGRGGTSGGGMSTSGTSGAKDSGAAADSKADSKADTVSTASSNASPSTAQDSDSEGSLLPVALSTRPELLWEATRDRLHQPYRAEVLPVTSEWVNRLRNLGYPAFLSGAGPTVMVLSTGEVDAALLEEARSRGIAVLETGIGERASVSVSG